MIGKFWLGAALSCLALVFTACSPPPAENPEATASQIVKKEYLAVNGVEIKEAALNDRGFRIGYPQISGLLDQNVQDKINSDLKNSVNSLDGELSARYLEAAAKGQVNPARAGHGGFQVFSNYNNILSINQQFYLPLEKDMERWQKNFTYRLDTGDRVELKDVFKKGTDYRSLINSSINEEILRQNLDESQLRRPFTGIEDSQYFYLTESQLVLCFGPDNPWFISPHSFEIGLPLSKLGNSVDIYEKYADPVKKLYSAEKLKRKWLPNDLEVVHKKTGSSGSGYQIEARYVQIRGMKNSSFEQEINRMLEERARQFAGDQDFIKRAGNAPKEDGPLVKNRMTTVMANFAGKICLLEEVHIFNSRSGGSFSRNSFCYDLKEGRLITLQDLLGDYPAYSEAVLTRVRERLRQSGFDPGLAGNLASLSQKASFFFSEDMIFIYFNQGAISPEDGLMVDLSLSELGEDAAEIFK